ncbi:MAG: trehalose-6-phosphate synthase, partial [Persicimonas sp.]
MPANLNPITVVSSLLPDVLGHNRRCTRDDVAQTLLPVLRSHGGAWVGSLARPDRESIRESLAHFGHRNGFEMHPVALDDADLEGGYHGFAHSVIWPLFHGMDEHCDRQPGFWKAYLELNRKFALHIARAPGMSRRVWIHDCGLIHTGSMLRAAVPDAKQLGFFLHLPFPPLDTLRRLATASQLVNALLDYDVVGFQTRRDLQNFRHAVRFFAPRGELTATEPRTSISVGHRTVRATVLPVGTDFEDISARSGGRSVLERMRTLKEDIGPYKMLIGVDRLDYTSGVLQRLDAFEMALERYPRLREQVILYQQVVPGRQDT